METCDWLIPRFDGYTYWDLMMTCWALELLKLVGTGVSLAVLFPTEV